MARRPPVIPEIAKAYQNDPRTLLANTMLSQGSAVTPVATGKYGMADGVARMLQGLGGAVATKAQMKRYSKDEEALLALRQQRGVDGLTGLNAGGAAAQLGVPPPPSAPVPPQAPPMPPQAPPAAMPGQVPPPEVNPASITRMGGAPQQGPRPFGWEAAPAARNPSAPVPPYITKPEYEDVPDAPAPVARPVAPKAEGATRSRMLEAAYRIMADGNAYESAQGQTMYGEGLTDQTSLDEKAAERRQHVADLSFGMDRDVYVGAQSADRSNAHEARRAAEARNFAVKQQFTNQMFTHGENEDQQAFQAKENALNRAAARINASIAASTRNNTKPLPFNAAQKLAATAAVLDSSERLSGSFDKRFVGRPITGGAGIAFNKVIGGDKDMAAWWQDYQNHIAEIRHGRSGANLTKQETALFNQYIVTPQMNADIAADNLKRQEAIVSASVARTARAAAVGYGVDAVGEAIGRDPSAMSTQAPTFKARPAAAAAPSSQANRGGGWGKAEQVGR